MNPVIEYLEGLTVTQGRMAGSLLKVMPWQKRFIARLRSPGNLALSVARGNGKTTLTAALACAGLDGPLSRPRGEIVIVASSLGQARIGFDHVRAFMHPVIDADPKRWRIWDSPNNSMLENRETGSRVRCIGSDPRRAHGLAPVMVILDEPAQWPPSLSERMFSAISTSMGKIPDSRMIAIGTRPASTGHWFAKMLADGGLCFAAGKKDKPFKLSTWRKANPSLKYMPDLLKTIKDEALKAKRDPSILARFESLRLNKGTSDVVQNTLLDSTVWEEIEGNAERLGPSVWGIDLGGSAAFSALCAYWPQSGRLEGIACVGDTPSLGERGLRDGVGRLYLDMEKEGNLIIMPGRLPSASLLIREALRRFGKPSAIASDRWREAELRDALDAAGCPLTMLTLRGQGYRDGSADVLLFRRECLEDRVHPVRNLLFRSAMSEAVTISDPAGNEKLAKNSAAGRRTRGRDDIAAAAICAVSEGSRRRGLAPRRIYLGMVSA